MGYFVVVSRAFNVLDAGFAEKLTYFVNGYIDFKRESVTNGSAAYKLSQHLLGDVGEIRLRKLDDFHTEVFVKDPPLDLIRKANEEEENILRAAQSKEEYTKLYLELIHKLQVEKKELRQRRIKHLHDVANITLARINQDLDDLEFLRRSFLAECLDDFSGFIQGEMRMSFWKSGDKVNSKKWISSPEKFAKQLLRTYLAGRYGASLDVFEEINTGAGRIDIYVISPQGERTIIELKMCGSGYSMAYAEHGKEQLRHYMLNKKVENSYLLIFDARIKDFSEGVGESEKGINIKTIDVRSSF
jgi:hypothetical protein